LIRIELGRANRQAILAQRGSSNLKTQINPTNNRIKNICKKEAVRGFTVLSGDPAPSFPAAMTTKKSSFVATNLAQIHEHEHKQ
jgi:hypothetical protein